MNLYVSDLDGTLLNSKKQLSKESAEVINSLIKIGLNFTIATARSSVELTERALSQLDLRLPIILNNGACIYELNKRKYILANFIEKRKVNDIVRLCSQLELLPTIYSISNSGQGKVYYTGIANKCQDKYIRDSLLEGDKRFVLAENFSMCKDENIVTIQVNVEEKHVQSVYKFLKDKANALVHYHEDSYVKGYYWIDIVDEKATKKFAIEYLKKSMNAEKVICFGDNLNDYSMFEISDYKYAVNNACEEIKKFATKVIDSNNDDGVAKFLKQNYFLDNKIIL